MRYAPMNWWAARPRKVSKRDAARGMVARCEVPTLLKCGDRRSVIRVVLWGTADDLRRANPGHDDAKGFFRPVPVIERYANRKWETKPRPCLGTMHLAADVVSLEIIAHECTHALVRRLQQRTPTAEEVLAQDAGKQFWSGQADEEICYDLGHWVAAIHAWALYYTACAPRAYKRS